MDKTKKTKQRKRTEAKMIAANKMYTARGEPIRNLDAYVAAGGRPKNSAGKEIRNPKAYQNAIEASVRQNTNDPKYLYHYTQAEAATNIKKSGFIKESSNGYAGAGTYLTAKPPRCKADTLLANNYGHAAGRDSSYVDQYIRVDADNLEAERVTSDRDVWKVNGNVDYQDHNGYVAERRSDNRRKPRPKKKNSSHYNHSADAAEDHHDYGEAYDQYGDDYGDGRYDFYYDDGAQY